RACRGKLLGPGRRRAAIAHLLRSFSISERMGRAVWLGCPALHGAGPSTRTPWLILTSRCVPGCVNTPKTTHAGDIVALTMMLAGKDGTSIIRKSSACGVTKDSECPSDADANGSAAPPST